MSNFNFFNDNEITELTKTAHSVQKEMFKAFPTWIKAIIIASFVMAFLLSAAVIWGIVLAIQYFLSTYPA